MNPRALSGMLLLLVLGLARPVAAMQQNDVPPREEIERLVAAEPFTLQTWPTWKGRLLQWIESRRKTADSAFEAGRKFAISHYKDGAMSSELESDGFAWYLAGRELIEQALEKNDSQLWDECRRVFAKSLELKPDFAYSYRNLALIEVLSAREADRPLNDDAIRTHLNTARRLNPTIDLNQIEGVIASAHKDFATAERFFRAALAEDPENEGAAHYVAGAILQNNSYTGSQAKRIKQLLDQFPRTGSLVAFHALALAFDGDARAGKRELDRARSLGADPVKVIGPAAVQAIESAAAPTWFEIAGWTLVAVTVFYAVVIAMMAGAGYLLAGQTRGDRALQLLGIEPQDAVISGRVAVSGRESALAMLYGFSLFAGLILFYVAVPFMILLALGLTGGLLLLIFSLGRIPVKLVVLVVLVGLGMVWSILKGIFAGQGGGTFGLPATREQAPRLHDLLAEVAQRVDTDPVTEVYVVPGASIGVNQTGRGPFGIFGVKKRTLMLGLSTMHYLTIGELKAILAHEYAHFSHKDTFYGRFIYQVQMSIERTLQSMGETGGWINYVNPVYWFFYLYYKAYSILSAGYSRSREYLADRMAAMLYGPDVFMSALRKVSTDGQLFESTIYGNINSLLDEQKSYINMYSAFRSYRDEQLNTDERQRLYQDMLQEKSSIFASHPTFAERLAALDHLPKTGRPESGSAMEIFDDPARWEEDLTTFLTNFMHHIRTAQASAAE